MLGMKDSFLRAYVTERKKRQDCERFLRCLLKRFFFLAKRNPVKPVCAKFELWIIKCCPGNIELFESGIGESCRCGSKRFSFDEDLNSEVDYLRLPLRYHEDAHRNGCLGGLVVQNLFPETAINFGGWFRFIWCPLSPPNLKPSPWQSCSRASSMIQSSKSTWLASREGEITNQRRHRQMNIVCYFGGRCRCIVI